MQYHHSICSLLLVASAGTVSHATEPIQLEPTADAIRHAGHIYYNIATGEKITTIFDTNDAQQPADGTGNREIWVADTGAQCADMGFSTSHFYALSDPNSGCSGTSCDLSYALFDWGEIEPDTVVDCVQIHWVTNHADTDTNSDSQPDGVTGFAARWTYWDAVGSAPIEVVEEVATPIVDLMFFSLPGEYPPSEETLSYYTADIDLGQTFSSSLTFEIGDTDGDPQTAANHNELMSSRDTNSDSIPDFDYNQNGLADWGWSISFVQPGTADVDNADSDFDPLTGIDGSPSNQDLAGVVFGSPTPGHAEYDADEDQWVWVSDGPTAGLTYDEFILAQTLDPLGEQLGTFAGPFDFGGLNCDPGQTNGYNPAAHFQITLYGPEPVLPEGCPADLAGGGFGLPPYTPDGELNFFDVSAFLDLFSHGSLIVDFAGSPDGSPDGRLNFSDVSKFLEYFSTACADYEP